MCIHIRAKVLNYNSEGGGGICSKFCLMSLHDRSRSSRKAESFAIVAAVCERFLGLLSSYSRRTDISLIDDYNRNFSVYDAPRI